MKIDCLILGEYATNCYILRKNEAAKDCLIIDTGLEAGELVEFLHQHKLAPAAAILTHGHIDHISGLLELRHDYPNIKVYIHKLDAEMLTGDGGNLSMLLGESFTTEPADFLVKDGDIINEAGLTLEVFHTPGHTPGGICLYSKKDSVVFSGDTLFADSVGRTDFPGGSMTQLIKGIREKLLSLPDETIVYPGHGSQTTIAGEKECNQYLQE
jgi:hydroxyacylglutathione hydrolase